MNDTDNQAIIKEVAEKSKILLREDDPIFALVEMNGILMRKYSEALEAIVKAVSASIQNSTVQSAELMSVAAREAAVKTIHTFQKVVTDWTEGITRIQGEHLERFGELRNKMEPEERGYQLYLQLGLIMLCFVLQVLNSFLLLKK